MNASIRVIAMMIGVKIGVKIGETAAATTATTIAMTETGMIGTIATTVTTGSDTGGIATTGTIGDSRFASAATITEIVAANNPPGAFQGPVSNIEGG